MKMLYPYGVSFQEFTDPTTARGFTYTTKDDRCPPTPIIFPENPYNDQVRAAKNVLDIGCGIGRNLENVMKDTSAEYYGLDPNASMLKFFWNWQDTTYDPRVHLVNNFTEMNPALKFDLVLCTFVFQHIGYRPHESSIFDCFEISQEARRFTTPETVWLLYEHDKEEPGWIDRWITDLNLDTSKMTYIRNFKGFPDLLDRGDMHHLILFKEGDAIKNG